MAYRQEYYEGEAEDRAEVLSLDEKAEVPAGYYPKTLMTKDLVPLEPKVSEHKFYAEGVGPGPRDRPLGRRRPRGAHFIHAWRLATTFWVPRLKNPGAGPDRRSDGIRHR